jgi:hypothetical protein
VKSRCFGLGQQSAKTDLLEFPEAVKDEIGVALSVAQFGGKHPKAKPWKGQGSGVLEIVEDHRGGQVSGSVYRKVRKSGLCVAFVSEEIPERHKDVPNRWGNGFSSAQRSR